MSRVSQFLTIIICLLSLLQTSTDASHRSCSSHHTGGKSCGRFNRFLQGVLKAREDLIWLDEVADLIRTKDLSFKTPSLQAKIDAMFYNNPDKQVWNSLETKKSNEVRERHRRDSERVESNLEKVNHQADTSSIHEDFNSPQRSYENVPSSSSSSTSSPHKQNSNFVVKKLEPKISSERVMVPAGTPDPLEEVLKSINVFPEEDDSEKQGIEVARDGYGLEDAIAAVVSLEEMGDGFYGEEPMKIGRSLKSAELLGGGPTEKDFKKLLKFDNPKDRSQINRAINGDLARKIVDVIISQTGKPGSNIPSNLDSPHDAESLEAISSNDVNEVRGFGSRNKADHVSSKLFDYVQQLIADEIDRRTCASLPPDMQNFLQWLLDLKTYGGGGRFQVSEEKDEKLEDNNYSDNNAISNLNEWYRKAETLESLVNEYEGLSKKEKNKVQAIYEYLTTRLEFIKAFIDAFKSHSVSR